MISNPSTSVINELFGKSRDAAASVAASGQTSATPGTATTHALAPSVKAVLVVNAGTAAIAASVDDGTNWVAIAASGSLLVDVPLGRVQVKCDTAARVPYSISATTRAISQTVVPAAVAALDALEAANIIWVGPGMRYKTVQAAVDAAVAAGAKWEKPYYIEYHSLSDCSVERDPYTNRPLTSAGAAADGVILVDLDAALIPKYPEAGPLVNVPMVTIRSDDIRKSHFACEEGLLLASTAWGADENVELVPSTLPAGYDIGGQTAYARFNISDTHAGGMIAVAEYLPMDVNTPGYEYLVFWMLISRDVTVPNAWPRLQLGFTELAAESITDLEADLTWIDLPATEWAWRPYAIPLPAAIKAMTGIQTVILRSVGDLTSGSVLTMFIGGMRFNHTGLSPAWMAARYGIPILHSVITDKIGETGFASVTDLREAQALGVRLASHSKTHGIGVDPPAGISEALDEVLGSKAVIEALVDNYTGPALERLVVAPRDYPGTENNKPLGYKCTGFVQPGWGLDSLDKPINVDTRKKEEGWFAQLVRSFYNWSQCATNLQGSPSLNHFTKNHINGNNLEIAQFLTDTPRCDTTIVLHGFDGPDDEYYPEMLAAPHDAVPKHRVSYAQYKALIKQLATWRDAGSIFVAGFDAYMRAARVHVNAGTFTPPLVPYGDGGNGTNLLDAYIQNGYTPAYPWANGAGGAYVAATGGVDNSACIKLVNHGFVAYKNIPNIVPGRTYALSYQTRGYNAAGNGAPTGPGQLSVCLFFSYNTDPDKLTLREQSPYPYSDYFIVDATLTKHWLTFTVPTWAEAAHVLFRRFGSVENEFLVIDDVRCCEVN